MKNRDIANLWKRGIFSTIVFLSHVERWNVTWLAEDQWEEEAPACMQVSQILCSSKSLIRLIVIDKITLKTPNPKFLSLLVFNRFYRMERQSVMLVFAIWTIASITFSLVHPHPFPVCIYILCNLCGKHLQELYTVYLTRFQTSNCFTTPNKNLGEEGSSDR